MNCKIGRFGVLTCYLIDPLSVLIDKISISHNNKYNSVGLYHINDDGDYNINLFDLYDCYHIKWTISHYIMSDFISSVYVKKIQFYPLDHIKQNNNSFMSIYNTSILKHDDYHVRSKLEKKFINIISGLLISYNYERSYNNYLINIVNNNKKGDELIHKILLLIDNKSFNLPQENLESMRTNGVPLHFTESIKNTFTLNIKKSVNYINIVDNNFEDIINHEVLKLKKSFLKIYTNHKLLSNIDISIFLPEPEFIKQQQVSNNIDNGNCLLKYIDIKNLGYWLDQIISSNNKTEQTLSLKNMITIYNNLIVNLNIKYIDINKNVNIILNPDLIHHTSSSDEIISIIRSNINTENKTDLSILSHTQLFDILIYIDSLRDSSGVSNDRFSGVQNIITKELYNRKNNT